MDQYKKRGAMVIYPPFRGKVRVPSEIAKERRNEISSVSLIEWVFDE